MGVVGPDGLVRGGVSAMCRSYGSDRVRAEMAFVLNAVGVAGFVLVTAVLQWCGYPDGLFLVIRNGVTRWVLLNDGVM